jgi:hypothetical protein
MDDTVYNWRCISTAWEQAYGRGIATDDVQLTVVNQPIQSALQVAMVSPNKLQAEESDVPADLPVGPGITTGQWNGES